jgi:hypothetical protein
MKLKSSQVFDEAMSSFRITAKPEMKLGAYDYSNPVYARDDVVSSLHCSVARRICKLCQQAHWRRVPRWRACAGGAAGHGVLRLCLPAKFIVAVVICPQFSLLCTAYLQKYDF